jgi:hypothetical protein
MILDTSGMGFRKRIHAAMDFVALRGAMPSGLTSHNGGRWKA